MAMFGRFDDVMEIKSYLQHNIVPKQNEKHNLFPKRHFINSTVNA